MDISPLPSTKHENTLDENQENHAEEMRGPEDILFKVPGKWPTDIFSNL